MFPRLIPHDHTEAKRNARELLLGTGAHELRPLRADDLLSDCLLETIKASLKETELHLISTLLALQCTSCR